MQNALTWKLFCLMFLYCKYCSQMDTDEYSIAPNLYQILHNEEASTSYSFKITIPQTALEHYSVRSYQWLSRDSRCLIPGAGFHCLSYRTPENSELAGFQA